MLSLPDPGSLLQTPLGLLALLFALVTAGSLIAFRFGLMWMLVYATLINASVFLVGFARVEVFGQQLFIATIMYAANFYLSDLIEEYYGMAKARLITVTILVSQFGMLAITELVLLARPFGDPEIFAAMETLIEPWRSAFFITLALMVGLQLIDTWLYARVKAWTGDRFLWLRNNISTITTQTLDSFFFLPLFVVFVFGLSWEIAFSIGLSSAIFKYIIALLDTPFLYLSRFLRPRELREAR